MGEPLITKSMIKEILRAYPSILDQMQPPYKKCAIAFYIKDKKTAELEELSGHFLEGISIVKKMRILIVNASVVFLHKTAEETNKRKINEHSRMS